MGFDNVVRLTAWISFLLQKLGVPRVAKEIPLFYGSRRFIAMFTRTHSRKRWIDYLDILLSGNSVNITSAK